MSNSLSSPAVPSRVRGLWAVVFAIILWGIVPSVLKYLTAYLDGWTVLGVRYILATLVMAPFFFRLIERAPVGRNIWLAAIPTAIVHVIGQTLWNLAPHYNQASVMMFIGRSAFFFSVLFGFMLIPGERALLRSPWFWVGVGATVIGLTIMFLSGGQNGESTLGGVMMLIVIASCWGMYSVSIKRWLHGFDPRLSFAVVSLMTLPFFVTEMFMFGEWQQLASQPAQVWWFLILAAVGAISIGHTLSYIAISHLGPVTVEGAYQSIPFISAFVAFIWLDDAMNHWQWVGGITIVLGSVGLVWAKICDFPTCQVVAYGED